MSANKKKNTGPSIRKDETSEEETDDTGSEEEDEHEFNKKEVKQHHLYYISLTRKFWTWNLNYVFHN